MTKRVRFICAAVAVVVVLAIVAVIALRSGSDDEALTNNGNAETANTTVVTGSDSTVTSVETTTSMVASTTTANPALNPTKGTDIGPVTFRTPQRCTKTAEPTGTLPGEDKSGAKQWVTVGRIAGSCDLSSSSFSLKAVDTRLAWRSDATSFNAFVLNTKTGIDASAGYADADCQGPCSESQALVLDAGTYVLRVQADGGPWELVIQEYR